MPNPVSRTAPLAAIHQDVGRFDVLVDEPAPDGRLPRAARCRCARCRKRSHLHRRAEQPVERLAARILQHQHGPTAVRGRAPAAAPPTLRPARPSIHIRAQGDRGSSGVGCSAAGSTASTAMRLPSARRRHPRQKTRCPPSSHKTWKLSSSLLSNGKNRSNCRTPSASRLSSSVKQAGASARFSRQQPGPALCQSRGTMTMSFPGARRRSGDLPLAVDGCRWQSPRTSACRSWTSKAAVPLSANPSHRRNVRFARCRTGSGLAALNPKRS